MPLRLALMVAVGALLALGACSSDTKTVAAPTTDPDPMTPDPDPEPTPDPDNPNNVMLPEAAATAFTAPRISFAVGEAPALADQTDTSVRNDSLGNRFRDVNGYRFTCEGADTCSWTIVRDADGMLSIATTGGVRPGVVPSVRKLKTEGDDERYFEPAAGNWDSFIVEAGESVDKNLVRLSCPADGADCNVEIEKRGDDRYLVASGGAIAIARPQMFYDGLAYHATEDGGRSADVGSLGADLGTAVDAGSVTALSGFGDNQAAVTISHHRQAPADRDTAPAASTWGGNQNSGDIRQQVNVVPTEVSSAGSNAGSMKFAGFATGTGAADRAKTYGAVEVDRRLGLVVSATYAAANTPTGYDTNALSWSVDLPVDRASGAFPYASADARDPDDRWSMGFTKTMRLDGGTADDMSDDGTLHIQVFTDHDTDGAAAPASTFGDAADGATLSGLLLLATGGSVPSAAPATQTITDADDGLAGTFDGVPGTFQCDSGNTCTVTTTGATQTLAGGALSFTPTTGAQMTVADSDWLAIGSWAVAMDGGATVYGAFVDYANKAAGIHLPVADFNSITDTYTYNGSARGHYAEYNDGARGSGVFAATAKFVADFDDGTNPGNMYGTLRDFSTTAHGAETATDREAWSIDFDSATSPRTFDFTSDRYRFSPNNVSGKWGAGMGDTLDGNAVLKFYRQPTTVEGINGYSAPSAVGGTFAATGSDADENYRLSLIGAVGAKR